MSELPKNNPTMLDMMVTILPHFLRTKEKPMADNVERNMVARIIDTTKAKDSITILSE